MSVGTYFERHAQTLIGALGRLAQQPFASAMIMGVIAIALTLPLSLYLLVQNARQLSSGWSEAIELSVYLDVGLGEERARSIAAGLRARPDIAEVKLITAAEALAEFRAHSGFGDALNSLTSNPLPNLLIVTPALAASGAREAEDLKTALAGIPGVASVQLDTEWVVRFHAILDLLHRVGAIVGVLLLAGIALVIGNTIRLDILNRRAEIEVMKLVGATDRFARRPFLYSGILYGFGGGCLAIALLAIIGQALEGPAAHLAGLYDSRFRLTGLSLADSALVVGLAVLLGWVGSYFAASRHIRAIEP